MNASKQSSAPISVSDREEIEFQRSLDAARPEQVRGFLTELVTISESRTKPDTKNAIEKTGQ